MSQQRGIISSNRPRISAPAPSKKENSFGGLFTVFSDDNEKDSNNNSGGGGFFSNIMSEVTHMVNDIDNSMEKKVPSSSPPPPSKNNNDNVSKIPNQTVPSFADAIKPTHPSITSNNIGSSMSQLVPNTINNQKHLQRLPPPMSTTTAVLNNLSLPPLTTIELIKVDELASNSEDLASKLNEVNSHLTKIATERDMLAQRLQERDSTLLQQYEQTSRQLEVLQNSVSFSKVNAIQSELNKLKEDKANLETRLVTAHEQHQVTNSSVDEWKKKAEEALTSKRNFEMSLAKSEASLAETKEELAKITELKEQMEIEMKSVNQKIEEKVALVRSEFDVKMAALQIKFENISAERNCFAQKTHSLAKELDRLLRESREKSTAEIHSLKVTIEQLTEEVHRKKRSLESVAEALIDAGNHNGKEDLNVKLMKEEMQDNIAGLKDSLRKTQESNLLMTQQINEYKATGKIRDFEYNAFKSKNSILDSADLP